MRLLLLYAALTCSLTTGVVQGASFYGGPDLGHHHVVEADIENWDSLHAVAKHDPIGGPMKVRRADESSTIIVTPTEGSSDITTTPTEDSSSITTTPTEDSPSTSTTPIEDSPSITATPTEDSSDVSASTTTAATPSPWYSAGPDGSPVLITPVVTTDANGATTTLGAAPTDLQDPDNNDDTHRVNLHCDSTAYEQSGKWKPFCLPHNASEWRVDENGGNGFYYVTWNPTAFTKNESVWVTLNYDSRVDDKSAQGIWKDKEVAASLGWSSVTPLSDWLDGYGDTVELYFTLQSSLGQFFTGPTITVTTKPKPPPVDTSPSNRPPVNTLGLAVGLPVVLLFILIMVLGTHFCLRERRKVGPIHIGGVRGRKEYGTRMSRRQRMKNAPVPAGKRYFDDGIDAAGQRGNSTGGEWELTDVQGGKARYDDDAGEYTEESARRA